MASIISMLRRNRKLRKKSRIRYKDALQMLKAYENGDLKLVRVIDNVLNPNKSRSKHCQVPGCGMAIRYEYVLRNKKTNDEMIAGSTCVWILLEMSECQIKSFEKIENSIKDFHEMLAWRRDNRDVWDKLGKLRAANVEWFKPFWEEVEYCKLEDEDTLYIRGIDVDAEIKKDQDKKDRREKAKRDREKLLQDARNRVGIWWDTTANKVYGPARNDIIVTGETDEGYKKVLDTVTNLMVKNPTDDFLKSVDSQSKTQPLTKSQIYKIKLMANKDYFDTHVKGTPDEVVYDNCEDGIIKIFRDNVDSKRIHVFSEDVPTIAKDEEITMMIMKYRRQFHFTVANMDEDKKKLWQLYRVKYNIIVR